MKARGRIVLALATIAAGLVVPASASAHAYLVKTVPAASGILDAFNALILDQANG